MTYGKNLSTSGIWKLLAPKGLQQMLTWAFVPSRWWVLGAVSTPQAQAAGVRTLGSPGSVPRQGQGCFGLCWAVENEGISPCEEDTGPTASPAHPVNLEARHWEAGTRRAVLGTGA